MNVFRQRAFHPHRFTQPFRRNFAQIYSLAALPQYPAKFAEALEQQRQIVLLHVGAGDQPHFFQPFGGHFAHAGDFTQGQLPQKSRHLRRRDDVLSVRFVQL
ncbi:hypothetical protein D3C79_981730 [compost metagenome]